MMATEAIATPAISNQVRPPETSADDSGGIEDQLDEALAQSFPASDTPQQLRGPASPR